MARRARLIDEVTRLRPDVDDPEAAITGGRVLVDGRYVTNPASLVRIGAAVVVQREPGLRGASKLAAALDAFDAPVAGRVALDCGAAAGGFTQVLLERGARRVYAVEAGHGQLLGSLRQDRRVVNLEATNLGQLDRSRVPDPVDLVTLDLSYLPLADAIPQLDHVAMAAGCDLVALVKPMFELRLATAPLDRAALHDATRAAAAAAEAAGWRVLATMPSPVTGSRGAVEGFLHAAR